MRPLDIMMVLAAPGRGQLKTTFTDIAVDLQKGSSALIDNDRQ